MAATITDKFNETTNGSRPEATTVTGTRSAAGTTLQCAALTGWPTATAVHFATYRTDAQGEKVAGSQCDWKGIVSGTQITNLTLKAGTDAGNAIGDTVVCMPTAAWADDLVEGLAVEHVVATGYHALTSNTTMTSPKVITSLNDTNGNELVKVTATGSAVNEVTLANAATGNAPSLTASGSDTNISLNLASKGTGEVQVNGTPLSGAWQSWTPTLTGWSANPSGGLYYYKRIGNTVILSITQPNSGTSNAITCTLTLPVTAVTRTGATWTAPTVTLDNGSFTSSPGRATIGSGGTTVVFVKTYAGDGYTASGNKRIDSCTIIYEAA